MSMQARMASQELSTPTYLNNNSTFIRVVNYYAEDGSYHVSSGHRQVNSQQDAQVFARDMDIVFMACHDHYVGHDLCSGSENNCSSAVAFCDRLPSGGNCKAHDYAVVPCYRPVLSEDRMVAI